MWFGGPTGAHKFDGFNWTQYSAAQGLVGSVNILFCDNNGVLYAGTRNNLFTYQNESWTPILPQPSHMLWHISDITQAPDGNLWCTSAWGLLHIRPQATTLHTTQNIHNILDTKFQNIIIKSIPPTKLPQSHNHSLGMFAPPIENGQTTLLAVLPNSPAHQAGLRTGDKLTDLQNITNMGMASFFHSDQTNLTLKFIRNQTDTLKTTLICTTHNTPNANFWTYRVLIDQSQNVIFSVAGGDILKFSPRTNTYQVLLQEYARGNLPTLAQTTDGTLWTANTSSLKGIRKFDGNLWQESSLGNVSTTNVHTAIHTTTDGHVWVTGHKGFLYRYNGQHWTTYTKPTLPLEHVRIHNLYQTTTGALWLIPSGSYPIQVDYHEQRWNSFPNLNFQCETPQGAMWFISADSGIVQYHNNTWTRYDINDHTMQAPRIIINTHHGIWAGGTDDSVATTAHFDGHKWHKTHHPKLSWNIAPTGMFEAADSTIWVGADVNIRTSQGQQGGVKQYDPNTHRWVHHLPPQAPTSVYCIGQTTNGTLWFGGIAGLAKYHHNTWIPQTHPPELATLSVDVLATTPTGELWVGHRTQGIFHHNGQTWQQYTHHNGLTVGRIRSILPISSSSVIARIGGFINRYDGQKWTTTPLPPQLRGHLRWGQQDQLWISFLGGSSYRMTPETHPPKTEITVKLNTVSQPGNTLLTWQGQDHWHQTPQDQLLYSFRLNNEPWSHYTSQTNHIFLALSSGTHTFQVKARDRDFNEDPTPASITFTVEPPLWRHPLIITGAVLLLCVIAIQTRRVVLGRRELMFANQELETRVQQRTEALIANETKYALLFNAAQDAIILIEQGHFIDCNPQTLQLFGCTKEQIIGQSPLTFSPIQQPDGQGSKEKAQQKIDAANQGQPQLFEWAHHRFDGTPFLAEVRLHAIAIEKQSYLLGIIRDITQRKQAEQEREKLITDLEAKNEELERFTYTVSHDLKSPLVTIQGFLGMLEKDAQTGSFEKLTKDIDFIRNAAHNMQDLLNDLLELSRIGRLVNEPESISLEALIKETLTLVDGHIQKRGVQVEIASHLPIIWGDRQRLLEALQNLIGNAIKFMGKQKNPKIIIDFQFKNGQDIISIQDNGIGIAPRYHEKIFGLFDRLDPYIEGTGIGLALVKRIVEHHNGSIWIESDGQNNGTTFYISLPQKPLTLPIPK